MKSGIKIIYSWGDEEPLIPTGFYDRTEIWGMMLKLASDEIYVFQKANESIIDAIFDYDKMEITLHYQYDNEYCYYKYIESYIE